MKVFEYNYHICGGCGCGMVVARTKRDAIKAVIVKTRTDGWGTDGIPKAKEIAMKEIDITKPQVVDHKWVE
jgi:hypothetical protein